MLRIDILSVLPELMKSPLDGSIIKRAKENQQIEIHFHDLKHFSMMKRKQVDDYPVSYTHLTLPTKRIV